MAAAAGRPDAPQRPGGDGNISASAGDSAVAGGSADAGVGGGVGGGDTAAGGGGGSSGSGSGGSGVIAQPPGTTPVAARARRSLAAARAARESIGAMVDSLRLGRPPLPPLAARREQLRMGGRNGGQGGAVILAGGNENGNAGMKQAGRERLRGRGRGRGWQAGQEWSQEMKWNNEDEEDEKEDEEKEETNDKLEECGQPDEDGATVSRLARGSEYRMTNHSHAGQTPCHKAAMVTSYHQSAPQGGDSHVQLSQLKSTAPTHDPQTAPAQPSQPFAVATSSGAVTTASHDNGRRASHNLHLAPGTAAAAATEKDRLKIQWARALVKRRQLEKQCDALQLELRSLRHTSARDSAAAARAAENAARQDAIATLRELSDPINALIDGIRAYVARDARRPAAGEIDDRESRKSSEEPEKDLPQLDLLVHDLAAILAGVEARLVAAAITTCEERYLTPSIHSFPHAENPSAAATGIKSVSDLGSLKERRLGFPRSASSQCAVPMLAHQHLLADNLFCSNDSTGGLRPGSRPDDARSCKSFTSSTAFGDDADATILALADVVDVLDARLVAIACDAAAAGDSSIFRSKNSFNSPIPGGRMLRAGSTCGLSSPVRNRALNVLARAKSTLATVVAPASTAVRPPTANGSTSDFGIGGGGNDIVGNHDIDLQPNDLHMGHRAALDSGTRNHSPSHSVSSARLCNRAENNSSIQAVDEIVLNSDSNASALQVLRAENAELRQQLGNLEGVSCRATVHACAIKRNMELQAELLSCKKVIGRLVQERNTMRRGGISRHRPEMSSGSTRLGTQVDPQPMSGPVTLTDRCELPQHPVPVAEPGFHHESIQRVLEWRSKASGLGASESDASSFTQTIFPLNISKSAGHRPGGGSVPGPVPGVILSARSSPQRRRRNDIQSEHSLNGQFPSAGAELADARSTHSMPVRMLDEFRTSAANSVTGDEIMFTPRINIFSSPAGVVPNGLRGLL